jgi:hypothetical protein
MLMRVNIAIGMCVLAVPVSLALLWTGNATPYGAMAVVAGVWLVAGTWLMGFKVLKLTHMERVQAISEIPVVPRTMIAGAVVLGLVSILWKVV